MLRTVQDLKQTVLGLEKRLERSEMMKEKATERMKEKEDIFKQNQVGTFFGRTRAVFGAGGRGRMTPKFPRIVEYLDS